MKILVIQSAAGYIMDPRMTKVLAIKALKSKYFKDFELTFVRLPEKLYNATFDIETGNKRFAWTVDAIDAGLAKLFESVDCIIASDGRYPWYDDTAVRNAVFDTKTNVYVYDHKSKDFVRQWA